MLHMIDNQALMIRHDFDVKNLYLFYLVHLITFYGLLPFHVYYFGEL